MCGNSDGKMRRKRAATLYVHSFRQTLNRAEANERTLRIVNPIKYAQNTLTRTRCKWMVFSVRVRVRLFWNKYVYAIFLFILLLLLPSLSSLPHPEQCVHPFVYLFQTALAFQSNSSHSLIYSRWTMRKYLHKQIANDKFSTNFNMECAIVCFRLYCVRFSFRMLWVVKVLAVVL